MDWSEVKTKDPIYLNLGGGLNCHPNPEYENYISVDLDPPDHGWAVKHDIRNPIPLPDHSVTRIHSEDFFEHISKEEIKELLAECYRLLKPGGRLRISVPDYKNPKDRPFLDQQKDPRLPLHVTLTHYELMKDLIEESPFKNYTFYHYWEGDQFIRKDIDYSHGIIKRTPENDPRCRKNGPLDYIKYGLRDFLYLVSKGFNVSRLDMQTRKGHPLFITSIVVDLDME